MAGIQEFLSTRSAPSGASVPTGSSSSRTTRSIHRRAPGDDSAQLVLQQDRRDGADLLTLRYPLAERGPLRTYAGAGLNQAVYFEDGGEPAIMSRRNRDRSLGAAAELGAELRLSERLLLQADLRWADSTSRPRCCAARMASSVPTPCRWRVDRLAFSLTDRPGRARRRATARSPRSRRLDAVITSRTGRNARSCRASSPGSGNSGPSWFRSGISPVPPGSPSTPCCASARCRRSSAGSGLRGSRRSWVRSPYFLFGINRIQRVRAGARPERDARGHTACTRAGSPLTVSCGCVDRASSHVHRPRATRRAGHGQSPARRAPHRRRCRMVTRPIRPCSPRSTPPATSVTLRELHLRQ